MQIPFLSWLLQGIPECIATATMVLVLSKVPVSGKVIMIGLLQAVTVYLVRLLPLTPGVHIIIVIFALAFFTSQMADIPFHKTILYSCITTVFLTVWEITFFALFKYSNLVSLDQIKNNPLLRALTGLPQVIVLFLTAWVLHKKVNFGIYTK